jgi:hypothetical protein
MEEAEEDPLSTNSCLLCHSSHPHRRSHSIPLPLSTTPQSLTVSSPRELRFPPPPPLILPLNDVCPLQILSVSVRLLSSFDEVLVTSEDRFLLINLLATDIPLHPYPHPPGLLRLPSISNCSPTANSDRLDLSLLKKEDKKQRDHLGQECDSSQS